jgi:hypothetical protein
MVGVEQQGVRDLEADLRMRESGDLVGDTVVWHAGYYERKIGYSDDEDEDAKGNGDGRKEAKTDG